MVGGKLVPVARQFGFSKSAVARHKNGCLAPKLAAAARVVAPANEVRQEKSRALKVAAGEAPPTLAEITSLTGLLGRLARSLDRLEVAADGAAADNAYTSLAALSSQVHRGIETAGKLQGLGVIHGASSERPGFVLNINVPQFPSTPARNVRVAEAPIADPEHGEQPERTDVPVLHAPAFRITFAPPEPREASTEHGEV